MSPTANCDPSFCESYDKSAHNNIVSRALQQLFLYEPAKQNSRSTLVPLVTFPWHCLTLSHSSDLLLFQVPSQRRQVPPLVMLYQVLQSMLLQCTALDWIILNLLQSPIPPAIHGEDSFSISCAALERPCQLQNLPKWLGKILSNVSCWHLWQAPSVVWAFLREDLTLPSRSTNHQVDHPFSKLSALWHNLCHGYSSMIFRLKPPLIVVHVPIKTSISCGSSVIFPLNLHVDQKNNSV